MPVQTKRKVATKKEAVSVKYERLRLRHWVMFWVLVAATHALVIAIFSNVDVRTLLPVNVVNDEQQKAEAQLINKLKNQVASLEESLSNAQRKAAPAESECETSSDAPIDTYVTYIDKETSVSMSLPYSFEWKGRGCSVPPALDYGSGIGFGPGHIYGRYASLDIRPREAAAEIIRAEVESAPTSTDQLGAVRNIRRRMINGLSVTSYSMGLDIGGTRNTWVAAGRTYTYVIQDDYEWLTDAEAIKIIQSLRVTK